MFDIFLRLGGTEIANSDRLVGYALSADCPVSMLKDRGCGTINAALDSDFPYVIENIDKAPWYDPSRPDVSSRFYGVTILSQKGLTDSSRQISLTQGILDGGTIGGHRRAAREARFQVLLLADGDDALEYGISWLSSALDGDKCGQHGDRCGVTDLEFFVECPPEPPLEERFEIVAEMAAVNLIYNPTFELNDEGRIISIDHLNGDNFEVRTALSEQFYNGQATTIRFGSNGFYIGGFFGIAQYVQTFNYTLRVWARANAEINASLGAAADEVHSVTIGDDWTLLSVNYSRDDILELAALISSDDPNAEWIEVAQPYVFAEGYDDVFIHGDMPATRPSPSLEYRYIWSGDPHESASFRNDYNISQVVNEDLFDEQINDLRRFMHDVSVSSGPLLIQELPTKNNRHKGAIVEFTVTSERGYIYTAPRDIDTSGAVLSEAADVDYNLVPNPRAIPARSGYWHVVDRNACQNPSLESNATGWSVIDSPAGVRVSGELRFDGNWSYRATVPADLSAGSNVKIRTPEYVASYYLDPALEPVYSGGLWLALGGNIAAMTIRVVDVFTNEVVGLYMAPSTHPKTGHYVYARDLPLYIGSDGLARIQFEVQVSSWGNSAGSEVGYIYADACMYRLPWGGSE